MRTMTEETKPTAYGDYTKKPLWWETRIATLEALVLQREKECDRIYQDYSDALGAQQTAETQRDALAAVVEAVREIDRLMGEKAHDDIEEWMAKIQAEHKKKDDALAALDGAGEGG